MKTKKEIEYQYKLMMEHTEVLRSFLDNPPKGVTAEEITETQNAFNEQWSLNDLMAWILDGEEKEVTLTYTTFVTEKFDMPKNWSIEEIKKEIETNGFPSSRNGMSRKESNGQLTVDGETIDIKLEY